ncbi:MAG: hypothetical protein ACI867_000731, partial [Glaciecola sp.]
AASAMLAVSLVTLGIKAGGSGDANGIAGDGPVAAGSEDTTGAPDVVTTPTPAPEPDPTPDPAPEATSGTGTDSGTDTGTGSSSGASGQDGLDDMPETGGGIVMALGGVLAAGSAFGLRRRR